MNTIREIQKINEVELERGMAGTSASWHAKYAESAWVYVGNLDHDLTEGDVICVMSQYGEVEDIHLVRDNDTGKSKGFCFLKYEDAHSCILAVDNLIGAKVCDRPLRVDHVERYRLPKHVIEQEEEKERRLQPGHAYLGQEIANNYNIQQGQDLFARPAAVVRVPPRPPPPPSEELLDDKDDDGDHNRRESKRRRKKERESKRYDDDDDDDRREGKKRRKKDKERNHNDGEDDDDDDNNQRESKRRHKEKPRKKESKRHYRDDDEDDNEKDDTEEINYNDRRRVHKPSKEDRRSDDDRPDAKRSRKHDDRKSERRPPKEERRRNNRDDRMEAIAEL